MLELGHMLIRLLDNGIEARMLPLFKDAFVFWQRVKQLKKKKKKVTWTEFEFWFS